MTVVTLPSRFVSDHDARELPIGNVVKMYRRYVTLELTRAAYDDLKSDATYYAGFEGEDFQANRGVCLSARVVLAELRKHHAPKATKLAECSECRETIWSDTGVCEFCNHEPASWKERTA